MSTKDDLITQLHIADTAITNALALANSLPDNGTGGITTPGAFDRAYAAAVAGTAITLDPSFIYPGPFIFDKAVVIKGPGTVTARASLGPPMPTFQNAIQVVGNGTSLLGVAVGNKALTDILVVTGSRHVNSGCRILGDPTQLGKRGIAGNGPNLTISKAYIGQIGLKGQDAQAFAAWNTPGPITLDDCYMAGAAETVLFGGADAVDTWHIPSDILINNCTLTKDPAWQAAGWQVKNVLEFKAARRAKVTGCDLSYAWSGYSQDGYLLVITPRNQDGSAPFSNVTDLDIDGNTFHDGAAWCQILGSDYSNPSGPLTNVTLRNNVVTHLDPSTWVGNSAPASDKIILVQAQKGSPVGLTFDSNDMAGVNIGSVLYFTSGDGTKAQQLNFTNNKCPASTYGIMGAGTSPDLTLNNANSLTWTTFVASGAPANNTTV